MCVARIHARGPDRFDFLLGEVYGGEAAATFAEALELLMIIGADKPVIWPWLDTATASRCARMRSGQLRSDSEAGTVSGLSMVPLFLEEPNIPEWRQSRKLRGSASSVVLVASYSNINDVMRLVY